jgi:phosphatidylinositol glycan class A protein
MLRSIFIREGVNLVHSHQALSSMGLEAILHARTMGIKTVFTDHSLFGFNDTASILTNKLLLFFLSDVDNVICVSHTARENTVLRAALKDPSRVYVVPNAIVAEQYRPREDIIRQEAKKRSKDQSEQPWMIVVRVVRTVLTHSSNQTSQYHRPQ